MYSLMSLKLRMQNYPSLRGCFSGMLLIQGVQMSSKPSKWLFGIIGGRHERNQSFLSLDLFSHKFKIFFWSSSMDPPLYESSFSTSRGRLYETSRRLIGLPANFAFVDVTRAGFKGGQTGHLPRASTTRGASTKTVKKL